MRKWGLSLGVLLGLLWSLSVLGQDRNVQLTGQFRNAEITDVIEAVAKLTGKNFIVDPRVRGKVTLIAPNPMPAEALYETLLAVLRVHGYAAVPGPTAIKIVPTGQVRDQAPLPPGKLPESWRTEVIVTRWVDAAQLVPILRVLVAQQGFIGALPQSNMLVISDTRANIRRLKRIIARLDRPIGTFDVIPLRHADGEQLIASLRGILPPQVKISFDPRANRLIVSGPKAPRLQVRALIAQLDVAVPQEGQVSVVYLHYAKAKALAKILSRLAGSRALQVLAQRQGGAQPSQPAAQKPAATSQRTGGGVVNIEADERMNALLISGPPAVVKALRQVIRRLDVRRAQVLIEAVIVELSQDKAAQLGVEWGAAGASGVGIINFTGTLPTLLGNIGNPAAQATAVGNGASFAIGQQYGRKTQGWAALLHMLRTDSKANIISTPTLMTLDNEEAEIVVGREVPFQTGSYATTGTAATPVNPFTTIERKNVGLKLKLRPLINEGDEVQMDIALELSDVLPKGNAVDLQTSKRAIKTRVIVGDGNVIVLGGLLTQKETETNAKVPGLGDLPLLGALFRNSDQQRNKTDLMMFIRPVIVRDSAVSRAWSRQKYTRLYQAQQRLLRSWDQPLLEGPRARLKPYDRLQKPVRGAQDAVPAAAPKNHPAKKGGTPLQTLEELGVY